MMFYPSLSTETRWQLRTRDRNGGIAQVYLEVFHKKVYFLLIWRGLILFLWQKDRNVTPTPRHLQAYIRLLWKTPIQTSSTEDSKWALSLTSENTQPSNPSRSQNLGPAWSTERVIGQPEKPCLEKEQKKKEMNTAQCLYCFFSCGYHLLRIL